MAIDTENTKSLMIDPFGRQVTYLRLSATDRCNLRCVYCMAENMTFLEKKHILTIEELYEVGAAFVELGTKKIRLTGGEPLVRNGVDSLITSLGELSELEELTMTTNGILLEKYLPSMLAGGIKRLNVSLDSIDQKTFAKLGRFDQLDKVLNGLAAAKQAGLKIRLNTVVLKGQNEDSVLPLVDYAVENGFDIAFIEEMPLGNISSHQRDETMTLNDVITDKVSQSYKLLTNEQEGFAAYAGPARYAEIEGSSSRIGFISPHSNNFCSSCNRVRVTVEGQLLLCLGNENAIDLRAVLRAEGYTREILKQTIVDGLKHKPKEHNFDVSETHIVRFMSMTGG
jgi:cyclic pyranopterin phosphate synthase